MCRTAGWTPELIAWVHTWIPSMIMHAYEHTKRPLSQRERDRYLAEQAVIGRLGGAEWVPTTTAELDDYVGTMRPRLSVNAQTREFIDFLMTSPLLPYLRPGHSMLRRAGQLEPAPIADSVELLNWGRRSSRTTSTAPGPPSQQVRWVGDVFARLFLTYISMPPADPNFGDGAELRRFAHEVLTPVVERAD